MKTTEDFVRAVPKSVPSVIVVRTVQRRAYLRALVREAHGKPAERVIQIEVVRDRSEADRVLAGMSLPIYLDTEWRVLTPQALQDYVNVRYANLIAG